MEQYEWMNELINIYVWSIKTSPQNIAFSQRQRHTQCIRAGTYKLQLPKDIHTNKIQTVPPPPSAAIYIS